MKSPAQVGPSTITGPGAGVYAYDRVPFHGRSVPGADCRRMEVVARLFGLASASAAQSRVLELGCGSGAHLLPSAVQHPHSSFVGCDLSGGALEAARRSIEELSLTNVEVRHADLREVDHGWGCFDYIWCHDVFSWVAPDVRQRILAILRGNLAPHGVAFVSYDALPGWHLHGVARDLMRYHAGAFTDPRQAVDQARAILAMAATAQDEDDGPYAALLREEYVSVSAMRDDQLFHLAFSAHHRPFYFHEFTRAIGEAGLQFLADADVPGRLGRREPAAARAFLDALPREGRQQYVDFLKNCTSRNALVCHREVQLRQTPDESVLRDSWISRATAPHGELSVPDALVQEALVRLEERHPEFVAFGDLTRSGALPTGFVVDAWAAGALDVVLSPPGIASRISDHPAVTPLVRLQARESPTVTNQKCEPVRLTDLDRHVVALLDGAHSIHAVTESVASEIQSGRIADGWALRLKYDDVDAVRLTGDILLYLRDQALLVA
ncbi:MAG: class I SAM-dependent methyltransferase [Vicinamibacterales bacterium]